MLPLTCINWGMCPLNVKCQMSNSWPIVSIWAVKYYIWHLRLKWKTFMCQIPVSQMPNEAYLRWNRGVFELKWGVFLCQIHGHLTSISGLSGMKFLGIWAQMEMNWCMNGGLFDLKWQSSELKWGSFQFKFWGVLRSNSWVFERKWGVIWPQMPATSGQIPGVLRWNGGEFGLEQNLFTLNSRVFKVGYELQIDVSYPQMFRYITSNPQGIWT